MGNTIRHKRSSTSGSSPSVSDLTLGEICINTYDGKLFVKKDDGSASIVEIGASSSTTIAASPPASPDSGDIYWDTEDTTPYIYYDDGSTSQWVALVNTASYSTSLTYDSSSRVLSSSTGSGITFPEVVAGGISGLLTGSDKTKLDGFTVDSSGRLLLGTTTEGVSGGDQFTIGVAGNNNAGMTIRSGTSTRGAIYFADGTSGTDEYQGFVEYLQGSSGYMRFGTTAIERLRIDSSGRLLIGKSVSNFAVQGIELRADGEIVCTRQGDILTTRRLNTEGTHVSFRNVSGSYVGTIVTTSSSTAYNTSSDYRLKENVINIADGITRIKQLLPKRFNFIADADKTVDGFLAHEAQAVVPEAVSGTKDEVNADGEAVMQGIDHAKLVPLLTAALQEAIAKIETLEQRLSDAGIA